MDKKREYEFLGQLAVAHTLDHGLRTAAEFYRNAFDIQNMVVLHYHRDGLPTTLLSWIPDSELRRIFDRLYSKIGFMLDPYYITAFGPRELTANHLREIAPDRFETCEYFQRYFSATRMVDELGATIRLDETSAIHLSIGRSEGARRFRAAEVRYFKLLALVTMRKLRALCHESPMPRAGPAPDLTERFRVLSDSGARLLTKREAQVAALIVRGHSSRAVGLKLGISDLTVKVHRRNLYRKLRISSQNELFSFIVDRA